MPEKDPVIRISQYIISILGWMLAGAALAAASLACAAAPAAPTPAAFPLVGAPAGDGRLFGHLPYEEAPPTDLLIVAPGFGLGAPCRLQRDAAFDLTRLLYAANAVPGVAQRLKGVSCYRTVAHQWSIFCRRSNTGPCSDAAVRARSVGPPGFSEHATGYAIDFGVRPSAGCPDVNACIANTAPGRWLLMHAPEYGFELSFPAGNAQGVTWEPWHWRWVGTSIQQPGAARARLIFARARSNYPASPAIADHSDFWLSTIMKLDQPAAKPPVIVLAPGAYDNAQATSFPATSAMRRP